MPNMKFLPVNETKFLTLMLKKGYQLSDLSKEIGHADAYLKQTLNRHGGLTFPSILLIEKVTGVPYEDYRACEEKHEEDNFDDTNALLREINRKLELLIGSQVKVFGHIDDSIEGQSAIIHLMERLEDTIFKAVDKAWRQ